MLNTQLHFQKKTKESKVIYKTRKLFLIYELLYLEKISPLLWYMTFLDIDFECADSTTQEFLGSGSILEGGEKACKSQS